MPYFGLLGYVALFALAALRVYAPKLGKQTILPGLLVSAVGALTSGYLMYTLYFVIKSECAWCLASACIMVATFLTYGFMASVEYKGDSMGAIDFALPALLGVLAIGLVGMNISGIQSKSKELPVVQAADLQLATLVPGDQYYKGDISAKVQVIEFADFYCPACRNYSQVLEDTLKTYPKGVKVTFRHLPLYMKQGHEWSLPAAITSEIAAEKGKYWDFVKAIFSPMGEDITNEQGLLAIAESVGLDPKEVQKRINDKDDPALARVIDCVSIATQAGLNTTPTFVVVVEGAERPYAVRPEMLPDVLESPAVKAAIEGKDVATASK